MVKPFSTNSAQKGKGFPHPVPVIIASMAKLDAVSTLDRYSILLLPNLKSASRQSIEGGARFAIPSRSTLPSLRSPCSRVKSRKTLNFVTSLQG